jgi:soluble lytic murein transglycosylase
MGLYRPSITAAADVLQAADVDTLEAPRFLARLRYPLYFADLIVPVATAYGIDPLLLFATVRQESLFDGIATSYATAQGLMQIIPATGEYIAIKLGWTDYQNSDLYRPVVSVQFGTYYLWEQLQTFEGDTFAALAAYNAGPGNAAGWKQVAPDDPDAFVEAITFEQPQTYVMHIYEQYAIYAALYGTQSP